MRTLINNKEKLCFFFIFTSKLTFICIQITFVITRFWAKQRMYYWFYRWCVFLKSFVHSTSTVVSPRKMNFLRFSSVLLIGNTEKIRSLPTKVLVFNYLNRFSFYCNLESNDARNNNNNRNFFSIINGFYF